jgi:hypothetical protein
MQINPMAAVGEGLGLAVEGASAGIALRAANKLTHALDKDKNKSKSKYKKVKKKARA